MLYEKYMNIVFTQFIESLEVLLVVAVAVAAALVMVDLRSAMNLLLNVDSFLAPVVD